VIVSSAGVPGIVGDMVKRGAAVIGAGTHSRARNYWSDIADDVAEKAAWIKPATRLASDP